ncbi:MAG: S1C family serine protease [Gaiellaceae bacterium]
MRPGALAAVAVVSALLGGTSVLLLGKATGWIDDEPAGETILVPSPNGGTPASDELLEEDAATPLTGKGFDASEIYAKRANGVVTVFALFDGHGQEADAGAAQGSGFVVTESGYVLTNSHVITTAGEGDPSVEPEAAETVYVQYRDEERVPATVVGWDVYDDVGLLKVDPDDHPVSPLPLGDSGRVVVGEPVAAIGSPFGNDSSLSVGVVAATERSIGSLTSRYNLVDAIQTDAPINRGNSGGPMFNARGEVVGINAQIRSESGTAEGVGFAVPINAAKRSMTQLIETGRVRYAWLGVTTQTVTPRLAAHFDFAAERGAAIQEVVDGSPAARAGLRGGGDDREWQGVRFRPGGDLVVAVDGRPVETAEDVVRAITQQSVPGQRRRLTVVRDGERLEIAVVLGERPETPPAVGG